MKQCPSCRTTYTDETLRFCLADGSVLDAVDAEQSTLVRSSGIRPAEPTVIMGKDAGVRVDIPSVASANAGQQQRSVLASPGTSGASSGTIFKIVTIVISLGILALLLVGVAGGVFYFSSGKGEPPANAANAKQQPSASPAPTKEDRDELRDQIANLEKRLDEQKKSGQTADAPIKLPNRSTTTATARVDSPGDGFLALRTLPSSEMGDRILKIPHGSTVVIGACGPVITPVKRRGRWCQASYNGYDGWLFDAYLVY